MGKVRVSAKGPSVRIIGIDCATVAQKVGLALCVIREGRPRIDQLLVGESWPAIDEQLVQWATEPTLLAVDAPLGWPALMADSLHSHRAGGELPYPSNTLFRRETDDVVADIAASDPSTSAPTGSLARRAPLFRSLHGCAKPSGQPIPLAWQPGSAEGLAAIEVYPAGTLAARGLPHSGYKARTGHSVELRQQLVEAIRQQLSVDDDAAMLMVQSDHALDAVLCTVAGLDFLAGDVLPPSDLDLAQRESSIWVPSNTMRPVTRHRTRAVEAGVTYFAIVFAVGFALILVGLMPVLARRP